MEEERNDSEDDVDDGKNVDEVEETQTHTQLLNSRPTAITEPRGGPWPFTPETTNLQSGNHPPSFDYAQ